MSASFTARLRYWAREIAIVAAIVIPIRLFIVSPFKIPSSSMVPTLLVGDYLFVTRFDYGFKIPFTDIQLLPHPPKRGDVAVFEYPEDPSKDYIKRIVGLPGDLVEYRNNRLFINGREMPLRYIGEYTYTMAGGQQDTASRWRERLFDVEHDVLRKSFSIKDGRWRVPKGCYFALGDNRNNSRDSRFWGCVPQKNLVGKARIIFWSWDSAHFRPRLGRIGTIIH
ncbi:MAG: signal peptidase I [Zetaproteobacteria bacterium]|nr:MAG: signal peptidase I [Zetaproteobacteria bacterium]